MGVHILMNVVDEQELRVAVIRDGRLEALMHERIGDRQQHLGNIYKAKVANVEPSLDAAFLDLGGSKNGFIHVADVLHDKGRDARIEKVLKGGQEILVQITKEAIRDKGPCCSMHLSLPGRSLVLMNDTGAHGVSKKIDDAQTRSRLRKLLDALQPPEGFGYIVRTAGADRADEEIKLDHAYLTRLWDEVRAKADRLRAPALIYEEADVVVRTLRDLVTPDLTAVVIDQEDLFDEARAFAAVFMPELESRIQLHREEQALFSYYGVEERLAHLYEREVPLPSGGAIVIEQTEALVSIDVNSGRNRDSDGIEATALHTNLEAVQAITEQLVLRDLGGLIIIDFIDMEEREHRRLVQLALRKALVSDKARTQVEKISRFGLVEMTRQRTRPSHRLISHQDCPHCEGLGVIKTQETFEIDVMRAVRTAVQQGGSGRLEVVVPRDRSLGLLNARRAELAKLEEVHDCKITVAGDAQMKVREFRVVSQARRGGRRAQAEAPVRPSLLAPLLQEQARLAAQAREMAKRDPDQLERELDAIANGQRPPGEASPAAAPVAPVQQVVVTRPALPSVVVDALNLRRLLFTPASPRRADQADAAEAALVGVGAPAQAIGRGYNGSHGHGRAGHSGLAPGQSSAKQGPPRHAGRRRRRR